jgi:hypothetical protein
MLETLVLSPKGMGCLHVSVTPLMAPEETTTTRDRDASSFCRSRCVK